MSRPLHSDVVAGAVAAVLLAALAAPVLREGYAGASTIDHTAASDSHAACR